MVLQVTALGNDNQIKLINRNFVARSLSVKIISESWCATSRKVIALTNCCSIYLGPLHTNWGPFSFWPGVGKRLCILTTVK